MLLKICGFSLIIAAGILMASNNKKTLNGRIFELESFITAFKLIKAQMSFLHSSIEEIFEGLEDLDNKNVGAFFSYLKNGVIEQKNLNVIFNDGLSEFSKKLYLNDADLKVISEFSKLLGITDIEGQINNIEMCEQKLSLRLNDALSEKARKEKPISALYIAGAAALGIVLL